jgi:hypothetical protein
MSDLLYAGDAYIKTTSAGGVAWVLRHITLTPYVLDWYADPQRASHIGTVQLAGGALLLSQDEHSPAATGGSLCVELDWAGQDFLPLFFSTADDSHDAVLVRGCTGGPARPFSSRPASRPLSPNAPTPPHPRTPHAGLYGLCCQRQ